MAFNYGAVLITVASRSREIATALIKDKLTACVNLLPIKSIYLWQGEIEQDREYQLIINESLG